MWGFVSHSPYGPVFRWFAPYRVKAVDLGRFDGAPGIHVRKHFKKEKHQSEESKKIEKIEKEAKQDVKEVKPTELSEQELDNVAGGASANQSKSNIKTSTL